MISYMKLIDGTKYSIGTSVWNGKDYSKVKSMNNFSTEYRVVLEDGNIVCVPTTSVLLAIRSPK